MSFGNILDQYRDGSSTIAISDFLKKKRSICLKGLSGSLDSIVFSATAQRCTNVCLALLHDQEEAKYFYNDVRQLLAEEVEVLLFPFSHKKPYRFQETENANVLQRAEVLNVINRRRNEPVCVISFPEALTEKVINKQSLIQNTLSAKVGDKLDPAFMSELLISYDFEKTDFVYEAGQFAIRGGIIDVFSFARERPYRIELFGDEIDDIREFDPESQLSKKTVDVVNIIPDVQTKLLTEERQSFLSFLPDDSIIWLKDIQGAVDIINKGFDKVSESFEELMQVSGDVKVVKDPSELYTSGDAASRELNRFVKVEFGKQCTAGHAEHILFDTSPQPFFHKNFSLLAENLRDYRDKGFDIYMIADNLKQLKRLETIFEEIVPDISFNHSKLSLREGFVDRDRRLVCYTDHQVFDRFHSTLKKEKFTKRKALTLKELNALQTGDYVVHMDYGIGRFTGLDTVEHNGNKQEVMRLVYKDDDLLYVSVHTLHKISRYSGKEGSLPAISKLGSPEWETRKKRVKRKVKGIAKDLIALYAKRKNTPGFRFPEDDFLQAELESSFMYEDTPDQSLATQDVKNDMEMPHPMDRLVCGDVGFGKTEVAIRSAFKAVNSGKQVAVLVPTTILALQHFHTFSKRLENLPVSIDYINRFRSAKDMNAIKKNLKEGKIDILIGTHGIVNKDLHFKDIGLMIIDEEQKFGVKVKERLKEMKVNIDALTLTATPIPRTLHFSLMGARDLSLISTPPPNRRPVTTELHEFSEELIRDAISREIRREGQVFFVHNRVGDIEHVANIIYRLVPDAKIGIAHGQMNGRQLEKIMMRFIGGEYDVLVSTSIIESGLDIPNANTIIINIAHMFGLSDLHQMRGRVGRSNTKAYCYLITPVLSSLASDARKRLTSLEEFSELGDGFNVAMRDLDIRGAGNLLGREQSGFIDDMGFEMYHKILDEAITELKETEFKALFEKTAKHNHLQKFQIDCLVETDLEILIPQDYISSTSERINLYAKLDNLKTEGELAAFSENLNDRFGKPPRAVLDLVESVKLRWAGVELGFEKLTLKSHKLKAYVQAAGNDKYFRSDTFGSIISHIKSHPESTKMTEYRDKLIITFGNISTIEEALKRLNGMKSAPKK